MSGNKNMKILLKYSKLPVLKICTILFYLVKIKSTSNVQKSKKKEKKMF